MEQELLEGGQSLGVVGILFVLIIKLVLDHKNSKSDDGCSFPGVEYYKAHTDTVRKLYDDVIRNNAAYEHMSNTLDKLSDTLERQSDAFISLSAKLDVYNNHDSPRRYK